jgi:hypothetical protein
MKDTFKLFSYSAEQSYLRPLAAKAARPTKLPRTHKGSNWRTGANTR